MTAWTIERIVHFGPGDLLKNGLAHFGFRDHRGRFFAVAHQRHVLGLVGSDGRFEWTVAARPLTPDIPNIHAPLDYPMFVDVLLDGALVVSNFGDARLYRIDPHRMSAELLVDGHALGMADMGNCVVDRDGFVWVNEVTGCRIWRFTMEGRPDRVLGDGLPGFSSGSVAFDDAGFSWIYDLRRGPDDSLYVLDSRNFAVRVIDMRKEVGTTIAGTGSSGYAGDGGDARLATFGGDPTASFNGPISLSLDEAGNVYIGDRYNHVVRMIDARTGIISTIAGRATADDERPNDDGEPDPRRLNLPQISSMDYHDGRLFVPTDLSGDRGDLIVLRKQG
ncbi:MAG: hypothetical protein ACXWNR_09540 [Candidatus Limnocylindrales bacterium]